MEKGNVSAKDKFVNAMRITGRAIAGFFYKYRYFWKKLGIALLTLAFSTVVIFFIIRLIPGDIVREYALGLASSRNIPYDEAYRLAVQMLNYDPNESIFMQFFRYVGGLFRGELGVSLYNEDITANLLIKQRLPWTLFISSASLLISFLLGTWLGSLMARKRKGVADTAISSYIVVSGSVPDYLMGLLLVLIFAYTLKIFPSQGNYDAFYSTPGFNFKFFWDVLRHAFLPIMAYVFVQTGTWTLMMRGSSIGVLGEDYIAAAKARGLSERTITRKYLKRNALLPLVTSLAVSFAALFGGSPLMGSIFNYPGIGLELSARIGMKDYFVVQGIMFFTSSMVILVNLITDSVYSLIDPRVRKE